MDGRGDREIQQMVVEMPDRKKELVKRRVFQVRAWQQASRVISEFAPTAKGASFNLPFP